MLEMLMQWYRRRFSDPEAIALLVILVAGFGIIFFFSGLLAPLLVAIVLAYLLEWPTVRLQSIGCSRRWATSIVLVVFVGILLLMAFVVLPIAWQQGIYLIRDMPGMLNKLSDFAATLPRRYPALMDAGIIDAMAENMRSRMLTMGDSVVKISLASLVGLLTIAVYLVLVPLMVFFLLKDKEQMLNAVRRVLPRNRANQMRPMVVQSSEDFYLAKARTLGMYNSGRNQLTSDLLDEWAKGNVRQQRAAQYGRALQAMEANKYDEARKTLQPLLAAEPGNAWYLDLATDIDLGQNKANEAINRLKNARDLRTNPVLQLNLANAYLQGGQPQEAANILNRYTFNNKDDSNGWDLLAQAEAALNNRDQELAARAEGYALAGRLDQAISLLSSASSQVKLGSLQQARYDARIDQLRQLQERFKPYTKM